MQGYDYNFDIYAERWGNSGNKIDTFFKAIFSLNAGENQPLNPLQGSPWLDISAGWDNALLKFYDGSKWVLANEYNPYIKDLKLATGSKANLHERIGVSINPDGTLKSDLAENMTEWINSGLNPTYIADNEFEVEGDQTDIFVTNRKIKATLDSSLVYAAVESSNYNSFNDVTNVILFDPIINSTIQKIEHSLIKPGPEGSNLKSTEWVDSTSTATYISADTFTVPGNYTYVFVDFRRLKITLDSSAVYSAVKNVNYNEVNDETTIVLMNEVINATIQKVEHSLIKPGELGSFPIEFLANELVDIGTPVGAVDNFFASGASSTGDHVELSWKNPPNLRVEDEEGNLALLAEFAGVKIVKNNSSYPLSPEDGEVIYDGLDESCTDTDVIEGQTYYYSIFSYSKRNILSEPKQNLAEVKLRTLDYNVAVQDFRALQKSGINELKWSNPSDSSFSGVLIRRSREGFLNDIDEGELVYQGAGEQYNDTEIEAGVPYYYTVWAYSNNAEYSSSDYVSKFYDYALLAPGPKEVVDDAYGGQVRFYGEVDPDEFGQIAGMPFNGSKLADYFGLTAGSELSRDFLNCNWLKFVYTLTENDSNYNVFDRKQRVLYIPKKPFRYNLSHDHIYNAGLIYGGYYPNFQYDASENISPELQKETLKTDNQEFLVRVLRDHIDNDVNRTTGLTGGTNDGDGNGDYDIHPDAEYTRLILSVFEGALNPDTYSWYHPNNIPDTIESLSHNLGTGNNGMYNNEDLHLHNTYGNGSYTWLMEVAQSNVGRRLRRGFRGASRLRDRTSGYVGTNLAWRPLLDYVLQTN